MAGGTITKSAQEEEEEGIKMEEIIIVEGTVEAGKEEAEVVKMTHNPHGPVQLAKIGLGVIPKKSGRTCHILNVIA